MQIEIYWSLQLDVPDLDPFPLSHRPDLSLLFASDTGHLVFNI